MGSLLHAEVASLSQTLPVAYLPQLSSQLGYTKGAPRPPPTVAFREPGGHSPGVRPAFSAGAPWSEKIQNRKV